MALVVGFRINGNWTDCEDPLTKMTTLLSSDSIPRRPLDGD